jgi:putative transcriptional regulator
VELLAYGYHNSHMAKTQEKLGNKIQKLRKETGLTQEEFAEKLNISRTHIGHIEQGRKSPSIKLMEKIAKALRVKVKDIFPF